MADGDAMNLAHAREAKRSSAVHYSTEIVEEILERLANGEAITVICAEDGMPRCASLFRWIAADPLLSAAYDRARESCGHVHASRAVQEAMSATDATIGRLRMDALKWAASKYAPKNYGDNMQLRHADADGEKLNTQPLVSELLTMLGPSGGTVQLAAKIEQAPATPSPFGQPLIEAQPKARGYKPRARPSESVEDLV